MPRAGLSATRVVEEAEQLADEIGLSRLTLTVLAERLGVRQPSLYKHIDGLPGLLRSITMRGKNDLAETLGRAAVGRAGSDAITAMLHAYRAWAAQHPGRYAAMQGAPAPGDAEDEAASRAVVDVLADVVAFYDLRGDDVVHAIRFLRSTVHGFVTLEATTTGGFALPVSVDRSFDRLVRAVVNSIRDWTGEHEPPPGAGA